MARAGAKSYNSAAPVNYVAGLGRGATGFTTRSDIGPARAAAEATDLSESNFSTEFGYSESLAQGLPYDEDDEAADVVWSEVDAKMDERRRTRREDKLKESLDKFRAAPMAFRSVSGVAEPPAKPPPPGSTVIPPGITDSIPPCIICRWSRLWCTSASIRAFSKSVSGVAV